MSINVTLNLETISLSGLELRIKEVAKELNKKMKDIAIAVGVSSPYLSRINSGNVTPNVKKIQEIAEYLEVPVHRLIVAPAGYYHKYDEKNNWVGIDKKF